jgi:4-amino-4-deoxy-L-arabinose transferase-like glycosyltransferase
MTAHLSRSIRSLPERVGHKTLVLLILILAVGLGLRAYRVVEPLGTPGDDAHAYYGLSKALYEEGTYGGATFRDASDWSPGAPLIYAASFYLTGGPREGTARIVEALLGTAAIVVVFLLGWQIGCRPAGLIGAAAVALYPPFIHSTGALYSEPPAIFTLPAAVLAFLWATGPPRGDPANGPDTPGKSPAPHSAPEQPSPEPPSVGHSPLGHPAAWRLLVPGLLFGLTALIRPEYLVVGLAFVVLAAIRIARRSRWRRGFAAAAIALGGLLVPIVPWTVHNAVTLHRLVPISTGDGKALYVGTFLPADGDYERVKSLLLERYEGVKLEPGSEALSRVDPRPLFDRVAARYPDMPRDSALGKIAKQNFSKFFGEDPGGYLAMTARKAWRMWSAGIGEAMGAAGGRVIQVLLALLGLAGLMLLGRRRKWWELWAMATPIALITIVGALSLATPRRNEILMTLVFPLAGVALSWAGAAISSTRLWPSRPQSSPLS